MGDVISPWLLPKGCRFHPTEEEIVNHYLKRRVQGLLDHPCIIPDVDICSWDPWALLGSHHGQRFISWNYQDQEWWFFRPYKTEMVGKRLTFKRWAPSGSWRKSGDDTSVRARETGTKIGTKKILVFYKHTAEGGNAVKTNCVIHEYHLRGNDVDRTHVLCHLKLKQNKKDESYPGINALADFLMDSDSECPVPEPLVQAWMNSLRELF